MYGRDNFGWHYPPGTERDPRAPWNQDPDEEEQDEQENPREDPHYDY